ncbi:hypothetical protein [Faecalibacter rhinopitheci]|uniref:Uncharacterized protein n=1 Tax=Faecalibacter rhinopitheci TaxID=2779678 RepID=A0A8J7FV78_9FLAO|nr:hypothetical protein [Faecalibacter rhinopitheci]MBF0598422.1 hypothetical protein [Faecalibacter rhinopitheci]
MNFSNIFLFIFSLLFTNLTAQINIEANSSVSGKIFKIDIEEDSKKYYITLKIQDSISSNKDFINEMEKYRTEYFNLQDKSLKSDSIKLIKHRMNILIENNTYYSIFKNEILKNNYKDFDKLIKLFKSESSQFFEKKEENKNRLVVDGTSVKIKLFKDKIIWSQSPSVKSHPEINKLLSSTLDILRDNKILQLDKKNTLGY